MSFNNSKTKSRPYVSELLLTKHLMPQMVSLIHLTSKNVYNPMIYIALMVQLLQCLKYIALPFQFSVVLGVQRLLGILYRILF